MSKKNSSQSASVSIRSGRSKIVAWILTDGKAGHEKQSRGLLQALGEWLPVEQQVLAVSSLRASFFLWLMGRFPAGDALPSPDLIVATGHGTHLAALAARRTHGGKLIVLMKPSFPLAWFDLCLVPEHDEVSASPKVIPTRGALNQIQRSCSSKAGHGLFLIGGPSKQFDWNDKKMIEQVTAIVDSVGERPCVLTTSRRTPRDFLPLLQHEAPANLEMVPVEDTGPTWVAERLQESSFAWISEDSVSMTYEALTAGCQVGLLETPLRGVRGRVARGVTALRNDGWVTRFSDWRLGQALGRAPDDFNEANRCAKAIFERWFRSEA